MFSKMKLVATSLALTVSLGTATAHGADDPAVNARQSLMHLYTFNLGILGSMAQGKTDYSAEAASQAADNLVTLTQVHQGAMWPPGTDNASMSGTRALPAIWENFPDVAAKGAAMGEAALAMQAAAGQSLEALQGAMGPLGGSCSACHRAYRAPEN